MSQKFLVSFWLLLVWCGSLGGCCHRPPFQRQSARLNGTNETSTTRIPRRRVIFPWKKEEVQVAVKAEIRATEGSRKDDWCLSARDIRWRQHPEVV